MWISKIGNSLIRAMGTFRRLQVGRLGESEKMKTSEKKYILIKDKETHIHQNVSLWKLLHTNDKNVLL